MDSVKAEANDVHNTDIASVLESKDADSPTGWTTFCIGCGACAFVDPAFRIIKNPEGCLQAEQVSDTDLRAASQVCPFASRYDENRVAETLFAGVDGIKHDENLGYFLDTYVGYVKQDGYRERGSSGGFISWLAATMLKQGLIDAVIHVKDGDSPESMYGYQISHTPEEVAQGAKSKYYPITMSEVLKYVSDNAGRYLFIGIPCFIKSVRLIARQNPIIKERIPYCIGLVCGHLKSDFFAKSEAWESGVPPQSLERVDFRYKLQGRPASDYAIKVDCRGPESSHSVIKRTADLSTTDWGLGYFKYNACDFCDDVLAETADVTFGDAWLPKYAEDDLGTNVIVVRNPEIAIILDEHADEIQLFDSSPDEIYQSQAGGFRHRRQGLSYRIETKRARGEWVPTKRRFTGVQAPSERRKKVYAMRTRLKNESFQAYHEAEAAGDFSKFITHMKPLVRRYRRISAPLLTRIKRSIGHLLPAGVKTNLKRLLSIKRA